MFTTIPDYDDVIPRQAREKRRLGLGNGRSIYAWRIGVDWFARHELLIGGIWVAVGRISEGPTWVEAVNAAQAARR